MFEIYYDLGFLLTYLIDSYEPDVNTFLLCNKKFSSTSCNVEDIFIEFQERLDTPRSLSVGDIIVDPNSKEVFIVARYEFKSIDFSLP